MTMCHPYQRDPSSARHVLLRSNFDQGLTIGKQRLGTLPSSTDYSPEFPVGDVAATQPNDRRRRAILTKQPGEIFILGHDCHWWRRVLGAFEDDGISLAEQAEICNMGGVDTKLRSQPFSQRRWELGVYPDLTARKHSHTRRSGDRRLGCENRVIQLSRRV
jgi:hypothetical protein